MAKSVADVLSMVKDNEVKFVDFRFTDTRGKEQHVTVPVSHFDEDKFTSGHAFDGSSIAGWKGIEASDMLLLPDPNTANIDPFFEETTLFMSCDVLEPGAHPLPLVAAAAAAGAGGDTAGRDALLDRAAAQDDAVPTYYGAAWVALGRTLLQTDLLDTCAEEGSA